MERFFRSVEECAVALTDAVVERLEGAVRDRGIGSLVVAGGSTPLPFFRELSMRYLPWSQVVVTLTDERWVGCDHPDSNEGAIRRVLCTNQASGLRVIGLKTAAVTPALALVEVAGRLSEVPLPFDVVVLGMGGDGHVASLFPGRVVNDAHCCLEAFSPNPPILRLSLTPSLLTNARQIFLLISGPDKLDVLRRARRGDDVVELPVRYFLSPRCVGLELFCSVPG